MPIGKDSITKRVAKVETTVSKTEVTEVKEVAPKAATPKKAPAKKASTPKVSTNVIANVSPETVKKVTGHTENKGFEKVGLGKDLPYYLL